MPDAQTTPLAFDDAELFAAQKRAASLQEIEAIGDIRLQLANDRLKQAVRTFIDGTFTYLDLMERLEAGIRRIGHAPELVRLLEKARESQIALHEAEQGFALAEGDDALKADEAAVPLAFADEPRKPAAVRPIRTQPKTLPSAAFTPELAKEYERFFRAGAIRDDKLHLVARCARAALDARVRYETVGAALAIPWWFIAGVHMLESTFNFGAHLHNGDSLGGRTRRVPRGRPASGSPPFSWEESAMDALRGADLAGLRDWSLARALYRWERYNGTGYRSRRVPSPYLWSFSTIHRKGKFVADGKFSAEAESSQCGAAVLLKHLNERGDVLIDFDEQEETSGFDPGDDIDNARLDPGGAIDDSPFGGFWRQNLSDVMHFKPREFLYKGASHARNGLNTDPPQELWPNVVQLARVLDRVRAEIGRPVKLLSVYRGPAYNRAVGGARGSLHTKFMGADFTVLQTGTGPAAWASVVDRLRDRSMFAGGIGVYPRRRFVHVDVRGSNLNWTG